MSGTVENDIAFLTTADSVISADMIEAMLRDNDIPVLKKHRGAGLHLKIVFGSTNFGIDMYVPSDLLEKAKELIDILL